jgi:hypothetical protein
MPKRTFRLPREGIPLLDIVSLGRRGPHGAGGRLTSEQVEQIRRTVQRAPEVMVKVLGRNSNDLKAAARHFDYIGRKGKLEIETDDGERLQGRVGQSLIEDWDLDIDDARRQGVLKATDDRKPPKLVHKLMFSMPPRTAPDKVLAAVRNFAREEFALRHRYAFVLHTDEPHPHVHLVLKAVNEQGVRLNIKKATLRHWRSEFARNVRLVGIEANATERAVRGQTRKAMKDGIYRASLRGQSIYARSEMEAIAGVLRADKTQAESGKKALVETRNRVAVGWVATAARLASEGHSDLANDARCFADRMPLPTTRRDVVITERLARERRQDLHDLRLAR